MEDKTKSNKWTLDECFLYDGQGCSIAEFEGDVTERDREYLRKALSLYHDNLEEVIDGADETELVSQTKEPLQINFYNSKIDSLTIIYSKQENEQ